MVKRDMNFIVSMFNAKVRNNRGNESLKERIGNRRKRQKETSKASFGRF